MLTTLIRIKVHLHSARELTKIYVEIVAVKKKLSYMYAPIAVCADIPPSVYIRGEGVLILELFVISKYLLTFTYKYIQSF